MITVEEMRRIKGAADRMDEATQAGVIAEWQSARNEFIAALDAVTDWSTAPEVY